MNLYKRFLKYYVGGYNMRAEDFRDDSDTRDLLLADAISISSAWNEYGLAYQSEASTFDLPSISGNTITLQRLLGITEGGRVVYYDQRAFPSLSATLNTTTKSLQDVYLVVEASKKAWRGHEGEDSLQRLKHSIPNYRLEVTEQKEDSILNFPNVLKIAEVERVEDRYVFREYIPPTAHVGAFDGLWKKKLEYEYVWENLREYTRQILHKVRKDSNNLDITNLHALADKAGYFLAANTIRFRALNPKSHPFEMFSLFMELANVFEYQFQSINRKDQLLEVFAKYTHSTTSYIFEHQGFQDEIAALATHSYDHQKILNSVLQVDAFLAAFMPVWRRLALASQITHGNISSPRVIGL
ncbi:MAG: hypothetical protein AAF433_00150 [Bacteroidota bacterium]